ncbi:MAG: TonB-dependent receptor [Alphaproteobacteria bacterium]|nr:MAG: TonB-dependent receptor [Alphaproteobacteria bacterium]
MRKIAIFALGASALALAAAPAAAQTVPAPGGDQSTGNLEGGAGGDNSGDAPSAVTESADDTGGDIIITAQRRAEALQNVPIAVSAFTAEALDRQQIDNSSDLQLTLPNITYTKTNFTSSSFTIRGIGDLCVGVTCDSATAIHVNDMPLLSTRLFESEYFDLERVEVLRGPQGTLFGRNATSGVVNFITARPDFSGFHASAEGEYGNYNSIKVKGMINAPISDTIGVRVAGLYINRDGYTKNLHDGRRIDDRDLYSVRGTLSWQPNADTRLDLIGYYFHENDNRSRIQKQLCHRDPTGVLGCSPDKLANETTNGNSTLATVLTSREFFNVALGALGPLFSPLALGSIYGPDTYQGVVNPADLRTVNIDYRPTYFATEEQYTAKFMHAFGPVTLNLTGGYAKNEVRSRTDYNLAVENSYINNPGLIALNAYAAGIPGPIGAAAGNVFAQIRNTLIPTGPGGGICQSDADPNNVGVYGGNSIGCFGTSLDFDESSQRVRQYSAEGHIDSDFEGRFNFLIGGIWFDSKTFNNSYYVTAFPLDYAAGILGAASTIGARLGGNPTFPNVYRASPFYRNNTDFFHLKSGGIFGETYFDISDTIKLTLGGRWNHDDKFVSARTGFLNDANGNGVLVPYGSDSITDAVNYGVVDYDAATPGNQEFAQARVKFDKFTGRAVLDARLTPDNLLYFSYSRGYKSGGINPPLSPVFAVSTTFAPEKVDAFEIGSKNSFANGMLRINATAFMYKYNNLQLSRIVARTSVNDNVNAKIYGVELESVVRPARDLLINMNASYLKTSVSGDKMLADPRDPSGGRSDAVIIKDLTNASNCAVVGPSAAATNLYVAAINGSIGLHAPTPVPGTNTTGAFGICSALAATAANPSAPLRALFGVPTGPLPFQVLGSGVEVNIKGNNLPQAPEWKFSVGAQYTFRFAGGMSLVPRVDFIYTGESYGSIFNRNIDRIPGYEVVNAQVQFNGNDDRWFVRAFVQNLTKNNAITGQYVTDQSSGLFTNVFTLEPRRYGVAAGVKF